MRFFAFCIPLYLLLVVGFVSGAVQHLHHHGNYGCLGTFVVSRCRHNEVRRPNVGLDVVMKTRLHKCAVLVQDALRVAPAFQEVPSQPPHQARV